MIIVRNVSHTNTLTIQKVELCAEINFFFDLEIKSQERRFVKEQREDVYKHKQMDR